MALSHQAENGLMTPDQAEALGALKLPTELSQRREAPDDERHRILAAFAPQPAQACQNSGVKDVDASVVSNRGGKQTNLEASSRCEPKWRLDGIQQPEDLRMARLLCCGGEARERCEIESCRGRTSLNTLCI